MNGTPFGFRIKGDARKERRLVDWRLAFGSYAACDPKAAPQREAYLSAFAFGAEFREHLAATGTTKAYAGPCGGCWLWFDIDRENDLDAATRDARRLCAGLSDAYGIDGDELLAFFSGSKGYHVGLPLAVCGAPEPSAVFHRVTGTAPDDETSRWLTSIDGKLADRLAAVGLIPKPDHEAAATLGTFLDSYIAGRASLKPNTKRNYDQTRKLLVRHFAAEKPLCEISPGDADEWGETLRQTHSPATVGREVKRARQYFRAAVRKRLIAENPFTEVTAPSQTNSSRQHFVTCEVAQQVLDACPDAQWRLIFALSRYGGLRCPSEHLALRWGDIDWERGTMRVRSPKTEHHAGGESRDVPLFPELRPHLADAFDLAEPGSEYVITRCRDAKANWRTQLLRIIKRAGVKPWPKPFHNLRATRQTELVGDFPLHVVCAWIGNSAPIADKHYLQVTDAHFEAAQKAAQSVQETGRKPSQPKTTAHEKPPVLLGSASECDYLRNTIVPPRGVEPLFPP